MNYKFQSFIALILLLLLAPFLLLVFILATFDTQEFGLFTQKRIGRNAHQFTIYKFKTMKSRSFQCGRRHIVIPECHFVVSSCVHVIMPSSCHVVALVCGRRHVVVEHVRNVP